MARSRFGRFVWGPYVPVAERRDRGAREAAALLARKGEKPAPIRIEGRKIATTYWGKAWCENLESYGDFANRLPRGRTYARNGSVVHLRIEPGRVHARVAGSELYTVEVKIRPLEAPRWRAVTRACTGKIASLIGLLKGELSPEVLTVLAQRGAGLFPEPREITMSCSCPDDARLCKHIAATLYGVGARLDAEPELFFTLRQVDQSELISEATSADALAPSPPKTGKRIAKDRIASIFGIELDGAPAAGKRKR